MEVKQHLAQALNHFLDPIRERRASLEGQSQLMDDILVRGTERMRNVARRTMEMVRQAMGMFRLLL